MSSPWTRAPPGRPPWHSVAASRSPVAPPRISPGTTPVPLSGLGAPHWDPYARGLIVGLTRGTGRTHLARAALEGMGHQTRDVVEAMAQVSGVPLGTLRADGGAAANAWLMQFQADMLGDPVEVRPLAETTALGAAFLAGLAVGFWESREALSAAWRPARRYLPEIDPAARSRSRRRWDRTLDHSRDWARDEDATAFEETKA
jgi:glycerol kinase